MAEVKGVLGALGWGGGGRKDGARVVGIREWKVGEEG